MASELEAAQEPVTTWRNRLRDNLEHIRFVLCAVLLVLAGFIGFLWKRILVTVPAGYHAVQFDRFRGGTVTERAYGEGFYLQWPWNELTLYETRIQQQPLQFKVLSEEGLELDITVAVRYSPIVQSLGYLHRDIGPEYFQRLVKPEIEGHLRHTFGGRPAHEIYSSARVVLQEISRVPLLGRLVPPAKPGALPTTEPYLRMEELMLVGIALPTALVNAINEKQKQEQLTLEYRYRLVREDREAERKRSEAAGIRDYSLIVGKVSPDVLRWRSVEATVDLAKSDNTKVLVLGNSQQNMPLMLNFSDPAHEKSAPKDRVTPAPARPVPARPASAPTAPASAPSLSGPLVPGQ